MKYAFKVNLDNGQTETLIPDGYEDKELSDFDMYVLKYGGKNSFIGKVCNTLGVTRSMIKEVIINSRSDFGYNLIEENPYFKDIYDNLKEEDTYGAKNYQKKEVVITGNSANFRDMRDYLFYNLRKNGNTLINEIYTRNTELRRLLEKYVSIYNPLSYSEEDNRNINTLERQIVDTLSIYRNYRGMAVSRYNYENSKSNTNIYISNEELKKEKEIEKYNKYRNSLIEKARKQELDDNIDIDVITKERTEDYNQDYDEYLTEDEYNQMAGAGNVIKR